MGEVLQAIGAASMLMTMVQQFMAAQATGTNPIALVPNAVATALASAGAVTTGGAQKTVEELETAFTPITGLITGIVSMLTAKPAASPAPAPLPGAEKAAA